MLTRETAVKFLEETLGIQDVSRKANTSRLSLLREYTEMFHRHFPFQNLTLVAKDPEERCLPSVDEVETDVLKGYGGMCYPRTLFTHNLFTTLGYRSYMVACTVPDTKPNTHMAAVMTDVEEHGDVYLVEVGCSFPSFEPVNLRDLPKHFKHSFLEYKFVLEGDRICRYHRTGRRSENFRAMAQVDGWEMFYSFENVPRDEEFLKRYLTPIYTVPYYGAGWFLTSLRMSMYPEGKSVTLNTNVLKIWDEQSRKLEVSEKLDFNQMQSAIRCHFPMLDHNDVRKALLNLQKLEKNNV